MKKKKKEITIKRDFTEEDLPHNRFQVFFDIVKIRYDVLFKTALVLFLTIIPLVIALFTRNVMLGKLDDALINGELTSEAYRSSVFQLQSIFVFIEVFCLLLFSIPISGLIRVYRLLTFYDGLIFLNDFFQGIKDNFKQVFVVFLIDSLAFIVSKIAITYLIYSNINDFLSTIIFFLPAFLSLVVILPISILHIDQVSIYNNKYSDNVKNAFFLYLKRGYIELPISLAINSPLFLLLIKTIYMPIVVLLFYAIVWLPFIILIAYIIGNNIFDKFINEKQYPEIFDKGIYRIK